MANKLNMDLAREIRATWKAHLPAINSGEEKPATLRIRLAAQYGVDVYTISQVLLNRTWREDK